MDWSIEGGRENEEGRNRVLEGGEEGEMGDRMKEGGREVDRVTEGEDIRREGFLDVMWNPCLVILALDECLGSLKRPQRVLCA